MKDFNPGLAPAPRANDVKGGPEGIEIPDKVENIGWQTRAASPTPAEHALADALQAIFAEQVSDLPGIVERLNLRGIAVPSGGATWTEEVFRSELHRLGA
jgi:hypothetical protein